MGLVNGAGKIAIPLVFKLKKGTVVFGMIAGPRGSKIYKEFLSTLSYCRGIFDGLLHMF